MLKRRILSALAAGALCAGLAATALGAPAPSGKAQSGDKKPAPAAKPKTEGPAAAPGAAKPQAPAAKKETAGGPAVAVVNGNPIPKEDFDRALQGYMQQFRSMPGAETLEPNDTVKADVLNQLIDRELLYQESKKFATDSQKAKVDEELTSLRSRFPSPEAFQEALKAQSLTEEELRSLIAKQVSVRTYVETHIAPNATVSDEDLKKFYEENRDKLQVPEQVEASHILIRVAEDAKPEEKEKARARAQELRAKAAGGADFAQLAKESSEDPGSAPNGGELGYFTKDRMVEPFATAAFALKPGDVSEVVETQFGFHVIKVTSRKEASVRPLEEVKADLTNYLKGKALQEAIEKKIADLRKSARIEVAAATP